MGLMVLAWKLTMTDDSIEFPDDIAQTLTLESTPHVHVERDGAVETH